MRHDSLCGNADIHHNGSVSATQCTAQHKSFMWKLMVKKKLEWIKLFCSLRKLYGRDILTWRRWNPLGWQTLPHVCCLLWGLETDTWGYLTPVWVHLIRMESQYYLNNNLNCRLHLLTLRPSCEVKLWKMRWGNASDMVPMSGTSCLITTL